MKFRTPRAANNGAYNAVEDTTINIPANGVLGNDTDAENNSLTAAIVTNASNGSFTLNDDGTFTYTPNADFFGADSFTFKTNEGSSDSAATVSINVTAVNDTPTITVASGASRQQNSAPTHSQIATIADVVNAANTVTVKVNGADSAIVNGVTVSNILIDANGNVTADISASSAATTAQFTLVMSDGSLSSTAL